MKKTLIKDYAKAHNISVQAVYQKIKNGSLFSSEIDKKKYIIECENVAVENNANDCKKFKDEIESFKSEIESLKSEKSDFKKENESLKSEIEFLKSKNDNSDEIESFKNQISFLKSDNKSLKKEKKLLEEDSSSYKRVAILFSIISVLLFSMLIFVAYKSHLLPF